MEARDLFEHLVAEEQRKVVEKSGKAHIYRGPFLARMELVRQLKDRKLLGELDLEIGREKWEGRGEEREGRRRGVGKKGRWEEGGGGRKRRRKEEGGGRKRRDSYFCTHEL